MQIDQLVRPIGTSDGLRLWHCSGCRRVHMAVGQPVINFDSEKFEEFAETLIEISAESWRQNGEGSIVDMLIRHGCTVDQI